MSAPTATMGPPPRRLAQALILLAVTIASGIVGFVVVSAVKHSRAPTTYHDVGPASATGSAANPPAEPRTTNAANGSLADPPQNGAR